MKAIKDNATYIENIVEQDDGDSDFIKVADTAVNFLPNEIPLLDTTTKDVIETTTKIIENDNIILIKDDNSIIEKQLNNITTDSTNGVNSLDILGDGSCIACYALDGDVNDLSGNYNGTWSGTEQYDTGKYGQGAVFSNDDDWITVSDTLHPVSISLWAYLDSSPNGNNYIYYNDNDNRLWHRNGKITHYFDRLLMNGVSAESGASIANGTWVHFYFECSYESGKHSFGNYSNIVNGYPMQLHGIMDQVRIFNRNLTDDEVNEIMNEESTKYRADISSLSLSAAPTKVFFNDTIPKVSVAMEATSSDITDNSFEELTSGAVTFDVDKFNVTYNTLVKQGRSIQRKITAPKKGMQILTPFTSNLYKEN